MPNDKQERPASFIKNFFTVIGIIAAAIMGLIIVLIIMLVIMWPFDVSVMNIGSSLIGTAEYSDYDHPYLTDEQESMLQSIGIDPADIPTEITAEQQACAVEALGSDRVNAILSGSSPSLTDVLKAKSCLE
ncbi:MAG: hypothetical protein ABIA47_01250 [bacterium]